MTDFKTSLLKLNYNLQTLREREAKYGGEAPVALLNQISDHQQAIELTRQAITGEITEAEWQAGLKPLMIAIGSREGEANVSSVSIGDVEGSIIASETAGRDISIGQKIVNIFTEGSEQQPDLRNRQVLLRRVNDFWVKGVLENSLFNEVLIELGMEERAEAVEHPWEVVVQTPNRPNRTLSSGAKIADVFEEMDRALLILGEPGSGKTTMLLELARDTIARAEQDLTQPIPVVFNLSTWAEKRQQLTEWLVSELRTKYNIPDKVAQAWVDNNQLLLLLDGLDEVVREHREACVHAINDFRERHIMPLVVCSRIADYEALTNKLKLGGAVLLQPLTPEQIETYLDEAGAEFDGVRSTLQRDPAFQELAKSPLMLNITMLAYRRMPQEALQPLDTIEARHRHLFAQYIIRMFERRGANQSYSSKQTVKWLNWLATQMKIHDQSVFLIELLRASWLPNTKQQRWYRIIIGPGGGLTFGLISGLIFGLIFGFVVTLIVGPAGGLQVGLQAALIGGLSVGVVGGLIIGLGNIRPAETLSFSRKSLGTGVVSGLAFGLPGGLIVGVMAGLSGGQGLVTGITVGVFFFLSIGLITSLSPSYVAMKSTPNQGTWLSLRNGIFVGLVGGLIFGMIGGLLAGLYIGLLWGLFIGIVGGLFVGLIVGLFSGGSAFFQHFTLRFILYANDHIPWNYPDFLNYSTDRIFLRRVGGGYIFIHRYLMEYFASLMEEDIERLAGNGPDRNGTS